MFDDDPDNLRDRTQQALDRLETARREGSCETPTRSHAGLEDLRQRMTTIPPPVRGFAPKP